MAARILVIEDNAANLELMVYLLSSYGFDPLTATDGIAGIEVAQRECPDLVICDVQLPRADGFEVMRRLKSQEAFRSIPFIAVTALAMVGDREKLLNAGFEGYVAKPISVESFVNHVESFLPSHQRSRARPIEAGSNETPASAPVEPCSKGTVLVVDDTEANRQLLRSILEPNGYTVVTASSLAAAGKEICRARPDLLLTDVHLHDGNSLDFVRTLRSHAEFQSMQVVFQSASAEEMDREAIRTLGKIKLLDRPLDVEKLLFEIETLLSPQAPARTGVKQ